MVPLKSNFIHRKQVQAFTLLEVLVALTIIAITLGAVIKTTSDQTASTTYLKQKAIGHWVAVNALNQLLLEKKWPSLGKSTDSISMARHEWHWQREVEKTLSPDSRKVIYKVFSDSELQNQVTLLVGYVTDPRFFDGSSKN